ncbi:UNVERIFIED_ORG: hypothetical protein GGI57_001540 [Rhizobium aethiopicum]
MEPAVPLLTRSSAADAAALMAAVEARLPDLGMGIALDTGSK